MFADPAHSGAHRPGFVHDRLNIDAYFAFGLRSLPFDPREQGTQFVADYFVIIVAPRITRDFAGSRIVPMPMRRVVVQRDDDHGTGRRKTLARVGALVSLARQ